MAVNFFEHFYGNDLWPGKEPEVLRGPSSKLKYEAGSGVLISERLFSPYSQALEGNNESIIYPWNR